MFRSYHHLSALIILTWNKQVINQLFYSVISLILPVNLISLWVAYSRYMEDHGVFYMQVVAEADLVLNWYWNVAGFQDEHYIQEAFLGFSAYAPTTCYNFEALLMLFILRSPTVICNTLKRNKVDEDLCIIYFRFQFYWQRLAIIQHDLWQSIMLWASS